MKRKPSVLPVSPESPSRRDFVKWSGGLAVGTALAGLAPPRVHAAEENTIRLALIGCGGRGNGAVANAFAAPGGPVKLVAMADIHERKLAASHASLSKLDPQKVDVAPERRFVGFDAYKKAIDCLRPGDVALLTTRAAFRPLHLEYAVAKGVNDILNCHFDKVSLFEDVSVQLHVRRQRRLDLLERRFDLSRERQRIGVWLLADDQQHTIFAVN